MTDETIPLKNRQDAVADAHLDSVKLLTAPMPEKMHKQQQQSETKWTRRICFAGLASTLGSALPAGYCIGAMNSPAIHMRAWCNQTLYERYDLQLGTVGIELLWSAIVSIFLVGGAIGSLTGAGVANRFGRRGCFYLCGVLFAISGIGFYVCRMLRCVELLVLARFIAGLAAGLTTACLPMYHSEIATLAQRGTLAVCCPVGLSTGVVVAQIFTLQTIFGSAERWHFGMSFYMVFVVLCYAPFRYYAESPKWLYIVQGKRELALAQLKDLRGADYDVVEELASMELEANQKRKAAGFCEVLRGKQWQLPLIIVCAYQGGQQLSGINAIFYYSVSIFRKAGLTVQAAEWANLGAGSLNLTIALLGPMLMARFNRRPLMLFSTGFCTLFLFLFVLLLYFIEFSSLFANGCIGCIFLYIFFFEFGVGPIPFFIGAELFEVAPRPVAMSLGSLSSWTCNVLIGMAFPSLQHAMGALAFLPFSATCLLLFLLTKFYLPETRGRDPTDVAPLVANGFKSKVH